MNWKMLGGILLGVIAVLWVLGKIKSNAFSVPSTSDAQIQSSDKWRVSEKRSPMDDSKTIVLSLDADNVIRGPLGEKRPTLIVRCRQKKTEVYVVTGMAASVEEDYDGGPRAGHKVGLRLDQKPARYETWGQSTDHEALFAEESEYTRRNDPVYPAGQLVVLAKELTKSTALTFQFTPFDGSPQLATFDLQGLNNHIGKVAEACGWTVD